MGTRIPLTGQMHGGDLAKTMVILGKDERAKFEMQRELFSNEVQMIYDEATTFHDGKWIMFELKNTELFNDMERLLLIKRKPNRKINI